MVRKHEHDKGRKLVLGSKLHKRCEKCPELSFGAHDKLQNNISIKPFNLLGDDWIIARAKLFLSLLEGRFAFVGFCFNLINFNLIL